MKQIFKAGETEDTFRGFYNAESWIKEQGLYVGSMERDRPIGISKEDWVCTYKWRHLTKEDKNELDGIICSGDKRNSDVAIIMFDDVDKREAYI